MPLKLNLGVSQKRGTEHFGSIGASCQLECELPLARLPVHPERLRERIARLYAVCRQAVEDELARQSSMHSAPAGSGQSASAPPHRNGHAPAGPARTATGAQLRALQTLARRQGLSLSTLTQERFAAEPEGLLLRDASTLIDDLKRAVVKK